MFGVLKPILMAFGHLFAHKNRGWGVFIREETFIKINMVCLRIWIFLLMNRFDQNSKKPKFLYLDLCEISGLALTLQITRIKLCCLLNMRV